MLPWNYLSKPAKIFTPKDHTEKPKGPAIEGDTSRHKVPQSSEIELHSLQNTVDESPFQVTGFSFQDTSPDEPASVLKKGDLGKERPNQENTEVFETSDIADEDENGGKYVDENGRVYPDGGREAWLVVFGSFMGLIPGFGIVNSLGAIESYVSKNQLANVSQSTISWIFSLFLVISSLSCVLTGGYFDRNGATRPMLIGIVFYTAGLVALADCQEVYHLFLLFLS